MPVGLNTELEAIPEDFQGTVQFDLHTPCGEEQIRANIASALRRKLPEAHLDGPFVRIIAGGPSARQAPLDGPTLAVNGALKLFTDEGKAPTWWACADPQGPAVENFLRGPLPEETVYLVASKCDPVIFERLKHRDVRVWHVSDFVGVLDDTGQPTGLFPIPCGSTVTTCAISLMLRLGYPRQEVWGWDCCFGDDGSTHANAQEHFFHEVIDLDIGGRNFKTTRSWALEAQDVVNKVWPVFTWLGTEVNIMGDGMLKAYLAYNAAYVAAQESGLEPEWQARATQ